MQGTQSRTAWKSPDATTAQAHSTLGLWSGDSRKQPAPHAALPPPLSRLEPWAELSPADLDVLNRLQTSPAYTTNNLLLYLLTRPDRLAPTS